MNNTVRKEGTVRQGASWGYHLLLDCHAGAKDSISDKDTVANFVIELVDAIDMVAFGPLWIERFATHDESKAGLSFCQMIETSNITGHFVDSSGDFYVDIFSCKPFDSPTVVEKIESYFKPESIRIRMIQRQA